MSMFANHCTACDRRQLIFPSMLTGLADTDRGVELSFTCWCGAEQTVVHDLSGERDATLV